MLTAPPPPGEKQWGTSEIFCYVSRYSAVTCHVTLCKEKLAFVKARQLVLCCTPFVRRTLLLQKNVRTLLSNFKNSYIFTVVRERRQFKCRDVGGNQSKHPAAPLCPYHYNSTVSKNK